MRIIAHIQREINGNKMIKQLLDLLDDKRNDSDSRRLILYHFRNLTNESKIEVVKELNNELNIKCK